MKNSLMVIIITYYTLVVTIDIILEDNTLVIAVILAIANIILSYYRHNITTLVTIYIE